MSRVKSIISIATTGAIWISLISLISIPLTYYRSWILAQFDETASLVGVFSLILIFIQFISTFGIFGGGSVLTNFLPKIDDERNKNSFIGTFFYQTVLTSGALFLVFVLFDDFFSSYLGINFKENSYYIYLIPIVALSQITIFTLNGLMKFRLVAVLSQAQLLCVVITLTLAFVLFKEEFLTDFNLTFFYVIFLSNAFVFFVGVVVIFRELNFESLKVFIPNGYWNFLFYIQGNTLCTFFYNSIDKLFIASYFGYGELGVYFLFLVCAELIKFLPNKIGQVFLATFSALMREGGENLENAYNSVVKAMISLSGVIAIFLIIFSQTVAYLFGESAVEAHSQLILLTAIINVGNIGGVNAMLVISQEKSKVYLVNSICQIFSQFVFTYIFIESYGLYAIVLGKLIGIIVAQAGLFWILKSELSYSFFPARYLKCQFFIISLSIFAVLQDGFSFISSCLILFPVLICYFYFIKVRPLEFIKLFSKKRELK